MPNEFDINPEWKAVLSETFSKPYFEALKVFINSEYQNHTVFPKKSEIFGALDATPFSKVRVVILGQDPYHGCNQANGLCFSVNSGTKIPPSLRNIYDEIRSEYPTVNASEGDLKPWAEQGVLLLNTTLTVRAHQAGSHQNKGWETFTDKIIEVLSAQREEVVYLLWGALAQKKGNHIDATKNLVLKSPHPSPLSAYRGFFGNRHFKRANEYLRSKNQPEIKW